MRKHTTFLLAVLLATVLCSVVAARCKLTLERLAAGLDRPSGIAYPKDGSRRIFILEQHAGRIRVMDLKTNTIAPTPFLQIGNLATGNEQGLLGMAFHPDYTSNGLFYVNITVTGGSFGSGRTEIREYAVSSTDPNAADAASGRTILSYDQPYGNHNGGWIDFGPDGFLYIASGDGGSGNDPGNRAQTLDTLLGKILRIDVDASDAGLYGIPPDNPFVDVPGARPEIWVYGLRNPWRCGFDRGTGDLYIGDVGQGQIEEVDYQAAESPGGENYGWRVMEGTRCADSSQTEGNPPCSDPSLVPPIYEYSHPTGFAVVGGYVYRGQAIGGLQGTYFVADYQTTRIWSFRYDGNDVSEFVDRTEELEPGSFDLKLISSFGEDEAGELYFLDMADGEVFRLVSDSPTFVGDFDHNCRVDFRDTLLLAEDWLSGECGSTNDCNDLDLDQSGRVSGPDFATFAQNWLSDTPVAHWKLDERVGSVALDSAGSNHATVHGGPTWQSNGGIKGGAIDLDGVGNYLSAEFVLNPGDGPLSVWVWIKTENANDGVILSQLGGFGENWLAFDSSGRLMTGLQASGRGGLPLVSDAMIADGMWHYIGLTYDGTHRTLYVDKNSVATDSSPQKLGSTEGGMHIGADKSLSPTSFFEGLIDDLRIYDEAIVR